MDFNNLVAEACFLYEFQKGQKRRRKVTPSNIASSGEAPVERQPKVCLPFENPT